MAAPFLQLQMLRATFLQIVKIVDVIVSYKWKQRSSFDSIWTWPCTVEYMVYLILYFFILNKFTQLLSYDLRPAASLSLKELS